MMRILFCGQAPLIKELGASKPILELAEELRELGWTCDKIGPEDFSIQTIDRHEARLHYAQCLRQYLATHAEAYDIVDYSHEFLPFPRTEFSPSTLFVARSVLLVHHLATARIPIRRGIKARAGALVKSPPRRRERQQRIANAQETMRQSDLVNVTNDHDRVVLIRHGIPEEKIVVLPFGISRSRRPLFDAISGEVPDRPIIAFVGTFDYRKGAREFPTLVQEIAAAVPDVHFRLLGTCGLYATAEQVLAHFPGRLVSRIEVIPKYRPEELPALLSSCSVGVFPSYMEGFPFGMLEMLAASVPVIAYDAPGASMMLSPEHLVTCGDVRAMSAKVIALLQDRERLRAARLRAREGTQSFSWRQIARTTAEIYMAHLAKRSSSDRTRQQGDSAELSAAGRKIS